MRPEEELPVFFASKPSAPDCSGAITCLEPGLVLYR